MPIRVYVDASIGRTTAGAGIRIDLCSSHLKPIDFSIPLGIIESPNEAEILAIHRAAGILLNLVHLIDSRTSLVEEYVILHSDSVAAVRALQLRERITDQNLRTLAKRAAKAWDDIRVDRVNGPGLIAGWSVEKISRAKNPAHVLAKKAISDYEDMYKWTPNATNSGTSSSKASKSARRQRR